MYKGTDFEDSWYFYHDALSVMTSASNIEWMKEMGYYDRWFLPKLDILHGTIYHSSIPGDYPELMPLDNSINNNYDQSALRHVTVTLDCQWNKLVKDMRKFSLCTPEEGMLFLNVHFNDTWSLECTWRYVVLVTYSDYDSNCRPVSFYIYCRALPWGNFCFNTYLGHPVKFVTDWGE